MKTKFRFYSLLTSCALLLFVAACKDDDDATATKDFPRKGLVAYYPFNGNANDESDENNNGTVNSATLTTDRYGNANKAYAFDGTDDYIDCGNDESLQIIENITICAWVKPGKSRVSQGLVDKKSNYSGYSFNIDASDSYNWIKDGDGSSHVYTSIGNLNEWEFITITYDGTNSKIYKNGTLEETSSAEGAFGNPAVNLTLGKYAVGTSYFNGSLDDIMIYNRALTADEITEVYNQTITK